MADGQARADALAYAKRILEELKVVRDDWTYLEAVIVEAILYDPEHPKLKVGLNLLGHIYNISVKGFSTPFDVCSFTADFMSSTRSAALSNLIRCTIMPEPFAIVFTVSKLSYADTATAAAITTATSSSGGGAASQRSKKGRASRKKRARHSESESD